MLLVLQTSVTTFTSTLKPQILLTPMYFAPTDRFLLSIGLAKYVKQVPNLTYTGEAYRSMLLSENPDISHWSSMKILIFQPNFSYPTYRKNTITTEIKVVFWLENRLDTISYVQGPKLRELFHRSCWYAHFDILNIKIRWLICSGRLIKKILFFVFTLKSYQWSQNGLMHNLQNLKISDRKKSVRNCPKFAGPVHWWPKPNWWKDETSISKTLAVRAFSKSEFWHLK